MATIVVLTGGGIKGAVAAARYAAEHDLVLVHIDFGQRSAPPESKAIEALASSFRSARVVELELPHLIQLQQQLATGEGAGSGVGGEFGIDVPELSIGSLRGLVPALLATAVQCAHRVGAATVVTGLSRFCEASHVGLTGTTVYQEGLREFLHSFDIMVECVPSAGSRVAIEAPLVDLSHADIVRLAVRFEVAMKSTWTCDRATPRPCGKCDSCNARRAAFTEAGVVDPLLAPVSV